MSGRVGVSRVMLGWVGIKSGVGGRETKDAGKVTVEDHGSTTFTAQFAEFGPAVLYLSRVGR